MTRKSYKNSHDFKRKMANNFFVTDIRCKVTLGFQYILKKVVYIQVGISTTKLELFVAGFIKTGKGYAKIRVAEKRYG